MSSSATRDSIDFSQQNITEMPEIQKPAVVVRMDLSNNLLKSLPNMTSFSCLRYLDLSFNKFSDLSAISNATSLRELNISHNRVQVLDFLASIPNLEVLQASYNSISSISNEMPQTLIEVDLSHNVLSSLEFLQDKFPPGIEKIDVSSNAIDDICSLRYIAVFEQLRVLKVGLLEKNKDLPLIAFARHLCHSLEVFDDTDCSNEPEASFDKDKLYDILVRGSETELRELLSKSVQTISWEEPTFIEFDTDSPQTPLKGIEDRLKALEEKLPAGQSTPPTPKEKSGSSILLPTDVKETDQDIAEIKREISEIRMQITQIAQMLYAHDRAISHVWENAFKG